jgi:hypothetical protein
MKVLTEKDIMDLVWHKMSFGDIITMDKEQKSKLSDISKILQDSLGIDDDNTI